MRFSWVTFALAAALPALAQAGVWKRTRADGTTEFTNVPPGGRGWKSVKEVPHTAPAAPVAEVAPVAATTMPAPALAPAPAPAPSRASTIWTRENDDGTVEFTNLSP